MISITLQALVLILLNACDWLTTRAILAAGGRELNPVMRIAMRPLGVDGALAAKMVIATAVAGALAWLGHRPDMVAPTTLTVLLGVLDCLYAWVVTSNWRVLRRQHRQPAPPISRVLAAGAAVALGVISFVAARGGI